MLHFRSQPDDSTEKVLNPNKNARLLPGDELIVLAEDDNTYRPLKKPVATAAAPKGAVARPAGLSKEDVLIVGWQRGSESILKALDAQAVAGSRIYVLSLLDTAARRRHLKETGFDEAEDLKTVKVEHLEGDPSIQHVVEEALELIADQSEGAPLRRVIILSEMTLDAKPLDSDVHNLGALMLVRGLLQQQRQRHQQQQQGRGGGGGGGGGSQGVGAASPRRSGGGSEEGPAAGARAGSGAASPAVETTFTVETLDSRTQVALQKQKVQHLDAQFVHGDTFIARTLAMVAMQEDDQQITEELLSDHGNFLLVQTAAAYVTAGGEDLSFLDVAGRALEHGEILVGTMTGANDKIDVNPENKREQRRWAPTDRIVCISGAYGKRTSL